MVPNVLGNTEVIVYNPKLQTDLVCVLAIRVMTEYLSQYSITFFTSNIDNKSGETKLR